MNLVKNLTARIVEIQPALSVTMEFTPPKIWIHGAYTFASPTMSLPLSLKEGDIPGYINQLMHTANQFIGVAEKELEFTEA
jgi:hypothetical protein